MSKANLRLDVVSDVVCPWCYLGAHRLKRAIALAPEIDVAVRWRPYQLDPSVPPEGMDRKDYIVRKFGSLEALDAAHERLAAMGREVGIDYRFDRITRAANTIDAHRVTRWAAVEGKEGAMVERLFAANFTEGLDVGSRAVLATLAGEVGLEEAMVARRLATDEDRDTVLAEIEDAYRIGVSGVPTFILAQRCGVVGAQSVETLVSAIRRAANEPAPAA